MSRRFYVRSGPRIAVYCDGRTSRKTRGHARTWLRDFEFDEAGELHVVREVLSDGRLRGASPSDFSRERFDESAFRAVFASDDASPVYQRWRLSCPSPDCRLNVYARQERVAAVLKASASSGVSSCSLADLASILS